MTDKVVTNVFYPLLSELLSRDQVLLDDMLSIIFVHEHFERSEVLLDAIVVMYSKLEESQDKQGQQKLINFIKNWIKIDKAKFTNPLRDLGKVMNENLIGKLPSMYSSLLRAALDDAEDFGDKDSEEEVEAMPKPLLKEADRKKMNLWKIEPREVAKQLTLIDKSNLKEIDMNELLHTNWTKKGLSPVLDRIAARADHFAHWIAFEILCTKPKRRTALVIRLLEICVELIQLQNFQSLMSIYLGLQLQPLEKIGLLKEVQGNLNYLKKFRVWEDICAVFDYSGNFKNYSKIKSLQIPLILSQEIMLKDLLFNEEAMPNFIHDTAHNSNDSISTNDSNSDRGYVNGQKLYAMGFSFVNLWKSRNCIYNFSTTYSDVESYLRNIPKNISLEYLYQLVDESTDAYKELIKLRKGRLSVVINSESQLSISDASVSASEGTHDLSSSQSTGDTKVKKERLGGRFGRTQRSNSKNASKEDTV